ncbi:type II secretion system F family protein [Streptomyces boninensis]|uniref:type II secretion system F family protein n=1 Tax=Streptomyces boninensis TaxID=2039455 RepID=UPI003B21E4B5
MTREQALLGLCGLGLATGLLLIVYAYRAAPKQRPPARQAWRSEEHSGRRLATAGVLGALVGLATGWLVGAVLTALAAWGIPPALTPDRLHRQHIARIEALASWTEMLRDTLAAAAGLEQTITATAHTAPDPIRPHIAELADRLGAGERLPDALRRLADQLTDPIADLVVAVLVLASEHQGRQLAPLLGQLAETARAQVEMRRRVEVSRARVRTTVRVIVLTTLCFAAALVAFNPVFLQPYDSAVGQGVLLLVGAIFTAAFVWLRRMAVIDEPERFLLDVAPIAAPEESQEARI